MLNVSDFISEQEGSTTLYVVYTVQHTIVL